MFQCIACADPSAKSGEGFTAYDYAIVAANLKIAEWRSEQGGDYSGKKLPGARNTAAAQLRHPPVRAPADKGLQKGQEGKGKR